MGDSTGGLGGWRPFRRAGRGQESLQEGWKGLLTLSRRLGGVGRHTRRAKWGRKALPEGREGSGDSTRGLGLEALSEDWRPSWRAGRGQETLQVGRVGSRGPPGGPGGVGRPSHGGWEAFSKGRDGSGGPPSRYVVITSPFSCSFTYCLIAYFYHIISCNLAWVYFLYYSIRLIHIWSRDPLYTPRRTQSPLSLCLYTRYMCMTQAV